MSLGAWRGGALLVALFTEGGCRIEQAEWGQRVVALVTALPGSVVDPELVIEHCRERLAAYKKPKEVRVIEHFPLNSTGKIAKKELRAQLDAEVPDARG